MRAEHFYQSDIGEDVQQDTYIYLLWHLFFKRAKRGRFLDHLIHAVQQAQEICFMAKISIFHPPCWTSLICPNQCYIICSPKTSMVDLLELSSD